MAGHSKFKNIQHRKGAQDAKRARLFARLVREIVIAARDGDNPDFNPKLRTALAQARNNNVPKDNIDRAIQKAKDSENLEEITYAGYIGSIALVVETTTDNHRRTASGVRTAFSKMGGELVDRNAVLFQFEHLAYINIPMALLDDDEKILEAADALGAINFHTQEQEHCFLCPRENLGDVRAQAETLFHDRMEGVVSGLLWHPKALVPVAEQEQEKLQKLIDLLEDIDCVNDIYTNAE